MEKLTQLIESLNSREILSIKKYYTITGTPDRNLKKKLFEIALNNKNISDKQAAELLKKPSPDASFSMLKKRLRSDILKILVWEENAKTFTSKFHEAKYRCRIMVLEAEILITRGLQQIAESRLRKALKLAERYELTGESITINELLQTQVGLKQGLNSYNHFANNNLENLNVIKEKFIAQDYFRKLTMPNLFLANKEFNYRKESAEATKELKQLSESSSSAQIKFWYLRSNIYYNHLISNYKAASASAEALLDLVTNNPSINSRDNEGGANMQLAMVNIYLGNYEKAIVYASTAVNYFVKESGNQVSAYDILLFSYVYALEYDAATTLIRDVKQFKTVKNNPILISTWVYYEANVEFLKRNFADALAILQKQTNLATDKSGWWIGHKILEMMCIIELQYLDWLDYRIETFRKLLSDVKKENIARPKLIHQILKTFIKTGYNFDEAYTINAEPLKLLAGTEEGYKWDAKSYELIRFDSWWKTKLKKSAIA